MIIENVTNVVFISICNLDLNATKLLLMRHLCFEVYFFIMFSNIEELNYIISSKIKSTLEKL